MKPAPIVTRPRRTPLPAALAALGLAALFAACAATRPADPAAPRAADDAPYPVMLELAGGRREKALANWAALVVGGEAQPDAAPTPSLRPVTATVSEIPALTPAQLQLPRVIIEGGRGPSAAPSDEELRESLRRFIASAAPLLGVEPRELSLVEIADAPNGARRAVYEQKPFSHPLRNGYGEVSVTFTPDLRVTALSSTAVPEADRPRRALNAVVARLSAEDAVAALAGKAVTYTDAAGAAQTRTVATAEGVAARGVVVFPRTAAGAASPIELRLAWELSAGGANAPLLVYVDAVTGDILGAKAGGN